MIETQILKCTRVTLLERISLDIILEELKRATSKLVAPKNRLLPDLLTARLILFLEVDLSERSAPPASTTGDTLVLWNTHNGNNREKGTMLCNVELRRKGKGVWRKDGVTTAWDANQNAKTSAAPATSMSNPGKERKNDTRS